MAPRKTSSNRERIPTRTIDAKGSGGYTTNDRKWDLVRDSSRKS